MNNIEHAIPGSTFIKDKLRRINPMERMRSRLLNEHHPYGLLLMSAPLIAASAGPITASNLSSASISVDISSDTEPGSPMKLARDASSAGALGLSISGDSPGGSLISTGVGLSFSDDTEDKFHLPLAVAFSAIGSSADANPHLANFFRETFEYTATKAEATIMPLFVTAKQSETLPKEESRIEIEKNKLRVGSVSAKAFVYKGNNEYTIAGHNLDTPNTVRPGDKFLAIHVNQDRRAYKTLDPKSRIKAIKNDFVELCRLLNKPDNFDLSDEQQQDIKALKDAPMIGVSHLVRLIATKKLPTWDIDTLPWALRKFHTFDSQTVSKSFGGERKISARDIKIMFLPASVLSQIL